VGAAYVSRRLQAWQQLDVHPPGIRLRQAGHLLILAVAGVRCAPGGSRPVA